MIVVDAVFQRRTHCWLRTSSLMVPGPMNGLSSQKIFSVGTRITVAEDGLIWSFNKETCKVTSKEAYIFIS